MSTYSIGWLSTLSIRNPISETARNLKRKKQGNLSALLIPSYENPTESKSLSPFKCPSWFHWKIMQNAVAVWRNNHTCRPHAGWLARLFCPSAFKIQWERWESMRYVLDWVSLVVIMYIRRRGWTLAVLQLLWEHGSVAIAKHFLGR